MVFDKALSKGAYGEVWLCDYNREKVAVKRLLQSKQQKADKVHAFAEEIELSASLVHPNIVEFIGVAWNSLSNLVMVLEFFRRGVYRTTCIRVGASYPGLATRSLWRSESLELWTTCTLGRLL